MDAAPEVPDGLLARLRADPVRAPEYIALAASDKHGPAARDWVASKRGEDPAKLAKRARLTHARYARVTGAATGVGGIVTMAPDVAAAVWIQSRLVFFIAAAYGFDPLDRMRPAELLVIYELYANVEEARAALDGAGQHMALAAVGKAMAGSRDDETLVARLTSMLVRRGARRLAGRAIPGVAIAINAIGNERAVRDLGDRAIAFYGG